MVKPRLSGLREKSVILALTISCALGATQVFADSGSSSSNSNSAGGGFGLLGNYTPSAGLNPLAPVGGSCPMSIGMGTNPIGSQVGDAVGQIVGITRGKSAGGASNGPSCASSPPDIDVGNDSACGGQDQLLAKLNVLSSTYKSCDMTLKSLQGAVQCVQNIGTQIDQEVSQLSTAFNKALSDAQAVLGVFKQAQGDVKSQLTTIDQELNGDKQSGSLGLINIRNRIQAMVNGTAKGDPNNPDAPPVTHGDFIQWKQDHDSVVQKHKQNDSALAKFQLTELKSCLTTAQPAAPDLRCPGAPTVPVSPIQYLRCTFQRVSSAVNGQYEQNAQANQNAQSKLASLDVAVSALFNSTPTDTTPLSSDPMTAAQNYAALTADTAKAQFVSQFSQFGNLNGVSVQQYMSQWYDFCNQQAKQLTATESQDPDGTIGALLWAQQEKEKASVDWFNQITNSYAQEWAKDVASVWHTQKDPQTLIGGTQCNNPSTDPSVCIDRLEASMGSLLTPAGGNIPITIGAQASFTGPGGQPIPNGNESQGGTKVTVPPCAGINNCIQVLQDLQKDRTRFADTLTQRQQSYVGQANAYLKNQVLQTSANNISQVNQQMKSQLQSMISTLQRFGVKASLPDTIQPEAVQYDQSDDGSQGLMKTPTDMAAVLSGLAKPALYDISKGLGAIDDGISDAQKQVGDNEAKVGELIAKVQAKTQECSVKAQMASLDKAIDRFVGACSNGSNIYVCNGDDNNYRDTLSSAVDDVNEIAARLGGDSINSLANSADTKMEGYAHGCDNNNNGSTADQVIAACKFSGLDGSTPPKNVTLDPQCGSIRYKDDAEKCLVSFQNMAADTPGSNGIQSAIASCRDKVDKFNAPSSTMIQACKDNYDRLVSEKSRFDSHSGSSDSDTAGGAK